jgi:hypothetical protein
MLRLVFADFVGSGHTIKHWSYLVHGRSAAFAHRAVALRQSKIETAKKLTAICCHKSQIKLSRRRFLGYGARPERFATLEKLEMTLGDESIFARTRRDNMLHLTLRLAIKPLRPPESTIFLLGRNSIGELRSFRLRLPVRSSCVEMFDCVSLRRVGVADYRGSAFTAEVEIPLKMFSPAHDVFVKLDRRGWFFDEAGWLAVPAAASGSAVTKPMSHPLQFVEIHR